MPYRIELKWSAAKEIQAIARKKDRQRVVERIAALAEAAPAGVHEAIGTRGLPHPPGGFPDRRHGGRRSARGGGGDGRASARRVPLGRRQASVLSRRSTPTPGLGALPVALAAPTLPPSILALPGAVERLYVRSRDASADLESSAGASIRSRPLAVSLLRR
jgi:hypothetical protein